MAAIRDAKLQITRDSRKKTAQPVVTCKVYFSPFELCLMKACPDQKMYKLKCQLWGSDSPDPDDHLYTYGTIYYFPDPTPTSPESPKFDVTVGFGLLDEDGWPRPKDEIYGRLILYNLFTGATSTKKTNTVEQYF
jgi:hypothetical protein